MRADALPTDYDIAAATAKTRLLELFHFARRTPPDKLAFARRFFDASPLAAERFRASVAATLILAVRGKRLSAFDGLADGHAAMLRQLSTELPAFMLLRTPKRYQLTLSARDIAACHRPVLDPARDYAALMTRVWPSPEEAIELTRESSTTLKRRVALVLDDPCDQRRALLVAVDSGARVVKDILSGEGQPEHRLTTRVGAAPVGSSVRVEPASSSIEAPPPSATDSAVSRE